MTHTSFRSRLRLLLVAALAFSAGLAHAEHRATRLGHPDTRFAPPLQTPHDLRSRFSDEKLRPDIASILQQWNWPGRLEDIHAAAATAPITEVRLPRGTRMPFMSSRKDGKPVTLRDVVWDGEEPVPAYTFDFISNGRRYRCITPHPCSNFFVEDLGPTSSVLSLTCSAPENVPAGRPVRVCLTVRNTGDAPASGVTLTLPVPPPARAVSASDGAIATAAGVMWRIDVGTNETKETCVMLAVHDPSTLTFAATAAVSGATPIASQCATKVSGIPAILLELVDLEDPIEVGTNVIYEIRVTNQGSSTGTNIRLRGLLPPSQQFVSGEGATAVKVEDRRLTMESLPALAPKAVATWRVVVNAAQAADARFRIELTSDQFEQPVTEEESTEQY